MAENPRQATAMADFRETFNDVIATLEKPVSNEPQAHDIILSTGKTLLDLERRTDPVFGNHGTAHGTIDRLHQRLQGIQAAGGDIGETSLLRIRLDSIDQSVRQLGARYGVAGVPAAGRGSPDSPIPLPEIVVRESRDVTPPDVYYDPPAQAPFSSEPGIPLPRCVEMNPAQTPRVPGINCR